MRDCMRAKCCLLVEQGVRQHGLPCLLVLLPRQVLLKDMPHQTLGGIGIRCLGYGLLGERQRGYRQVSRPANLVNMLVVFRQPVPANVIGQDI